MASICELEEWHSVNSGCYKNDQACATFIEFISKMPCSQPSHSASSSASNHRCRECRGRVVLGPSLQSLLYRWQGSCTFFCARHLSCGTGEGLYESLERAIQFECIYLPCFDLSWT